MITKLQLEELVEKYETVDFIKNDPIQFPHRFKKAEDVEIAAFLASLFAYGNRKVFVKKLEELFCIMDNEPYKFVLKFSSEKLKGFNYRFAKDTDIIAVFEVLKRLYEGNNRLKSLFEYGFQLDGTVITMLQTVVDYFYSNVEREVGQGFYHLIPNPQNKGAMKRMNMFLRWMVRKPPVDIGVWDFIQPDKLLIPLDVHVSRVSRQMGLLHRNSNDFKAVLELTENLKKLEQNDPVKFDFAMFGLGIDSSINKN